MVGFSCMIPWKPAPDIRTFIFPHVELACVPSVKSRLYVKKIYVIEIKSN